MTKSEHLLKKAREQAEFELNADVFEAEVQRQKRLILTNKNKTLFDRLFPWSIKLTIKRKV